MKNILRVILASLLLCTGASVSAWADDDALYDAPIPADKSLVRILNATQAPGLTVRINGETIEVDTDVLSGYKIITGGDAKVDSADATEQVKFEPTKFYTLVIGGTAAGRKPIFVIEDKVAQNRSGSSLSFYNMTSSPADLALKLKGKTKKAFAGIKPGEQAFREIIPVDIGIDVLVDGKPVKSFESVKLSATERQSVVTTLVGNEVRTFVVANSIEK